MFGMFERHLWLSLWERPAHSRFSRAQRVTCSALTLHLYLALAALWYAAVGTVGQRLENQNSNYQNATHQISGQLVFKKTKNRCCIFDAVNSFLILLLIYD